MKSDLHILKLKRVQYYKEVKRVANILLEKNKEAKLKKSPKWERKVLEHNIILLTKRIRESNESLKDERLEKEILNIFHKKKYELKTAGFSMSEVLDKFNWGNEIFKLYRLSPTYSIEYDVFWISDGTVQDQLDVLKGVKDMSIFNVYVPDRVQVFKIKSNFFFHAKNEFIEWKELMDQIIKSYENGDYLIGSISIHPLIEGVIRSFYLKVLKDQKPDNTVEELKMEISKFKSIEQLVENMDLGKVIKLQLIDALFLLDYIVDPELEDLRLKFDRMKKIKVLTDSIKILAQNKMSFSNDGKLNEEDKNQFTNEVMALLENSENKELLEMKNEEMLNVQSGSFYITLKVALNFLLRRYKEDRNSIIHGKVDLLNKRWKVLIYLRYLEEIFKVITNYSSENTA